MLNQQRTFIKTPQTLDKNQEKHHVRHKVYSSQVQLTGQVPKQNPCSLEHDTRNQTKPLEELCRQRQVINKLCADKQDGTPVTLNSHSFALG
jgi:hypothetical protein